MPMTKHQKEAILYKARIKSSRRKGCLEWTGSKNQAGYGLIEYTDSITKKRTVLPIHRALYMINNNIELTRFQFVCHKCDNPACIDMRHMFLGSPRDNSLDMVAKGRKTSTKGKPHRKHHRRTKQQIYIDTYGNKPA